MEIKRVKERKSERERRKGSKISVGNVVFIVIRAQNHNPCFLITSNYLCTDARRESAYFPFNVFVCVVCDIAYASMQLQFIFIFT